MNLAVDTYIQPNLDRSTGVRASMNPVALRSVLIRLLCGTLLVSSSLAQDAAAGSAEPLPFPGLLKRAERNAGNPLATYAAMLDLEERYRRSPVFAAVYPEVRCNYEQFLGLPHAGEEAMSLPGLRSAQRSEEVPVPAGYSPEDAVAVIARQAGKTRLVIFGEEHHLPQTRSLYEAILRALWKLGYRYLAAETFAAGVMKESHSFPDYDSGYYTMDPVFASALRTARSLGYALISYDTSERGPEGDASFRDRTQAENLKKAVFDRDKDSKLLVFAGRGHAAEIAPPDGWTPMASVLKRITDIDPFTIYAPTMCQRKTPDEEDPMYRYATANDLVQRPVVFVGAYGKCLGSSNCDAYVFWPRPAVVDGRPDWMAKTMGRRAITVPRDMCPEKGMLLVQAFLPGERDTAIPIDQILLRAGEPTPVLMLPAGAFRVRAIDAAGATKGPVKVEVP